MDSGNEVAVEILPFIRTYKDGRVERLLGTQTVPPSLDPSTGVASKDVVIHPDTTGVSARLYLPDITNLSPGKKLPVLVYYHGGGFCVESAFSPTFHHYLNSLVAQAMVVTVSVNYRLAPEHPIPAAYDDSWQALQWVASGGDEWLADHADLARVFVGGDSAGANIAHHMALRVGEAGFDQHERVEGLVLLHPYFWGAKRLGSEGEDRGDTLLNASTPDAMWRLVCARDSTAAEEEDPQLNPLAEGAPSLEGVGCRRAIVAVAGRDVLRERGLAYCEGLRRCGWEGEVEVFESEGEDHVFHLFKPGCDKALEMMERLVSFLLKC